MVPYENSANKTSSQMNLFKTDYYLLIPFE